MYYLDSACQIQIDAAPAAWKRAAHDRICGEEHRAAVRARTCAPLRRRTGRRCYGSSTEKYFFKD